MDGPLSLSPRSVEFAFQFVYLGCLCRMGNLINSQIKPNNPIIEKRSSELTLQSLFGLIIFLKERVRPIMSLVLVISCLLILVTNDGSIES